MTWLPALVLLTVGLASTPALADHLCITPGTGVPGTEFPPGCLTSGHSSPEPAPPPDTSSPDRDQDGVPDLDDACPDVAGVPELGGAAGLGCPESQDVSSEEEPLPTPLDGPEDGSGGGREPITCGDAVPCEDGVPHLELDVVLVRLSEEERARRGLGPDDVVVQATLDAAGRDLLSRLLNEAFDDDGDGRLFSDPVETGNMRCDGFFEGPPGAAVEVVDVPPGDPCNVLIRLRLLLRDGPEPDAEHCVGLTVSDRRTGAEVVRLWWCFAFDDALTPRPIFMPVGPAADPDDGPAPGGEGPEDGLRRPLALASASGLASFGPLSVVINEVNWAGAGRDPEAQFIELYNATSLPIDLTGWRVVSSQGNTEVALQGTIPAQGFFLLERPDDTSVADVDADLIYADGLDPDGEGLKLLAPDGQTVDEVNADGGPWPAGFRQGGIVACMERVNPHAPGDDANWGNNDGLTHNGFDAQGNPLNCTPGRTNSLTGAAVVGEATQAPSLSSRLTPLPIPAPHLPAPQQPGVFGRTLTVDDDGPADFSSVADAVEAAYGGDVIQVAPGSYSGQVVLRRSGITLLGAGADRTFLEHDDVVLIVAGARAVSVAGFSVRYTGSAPHAAVVAFQAGLSLDNCVIQGATLSGVEVRGDDALVALKGNRIHDNAGSGVLVHRGGHARLEGNVVTGNGLSGVEVKGPASADLAGNVIETNAGSGVFIHQGARAQLDGNLLLNNALHGVSVPDEANVGLSDNTFLFSGQLGLRVRGQDAQVSAVGNFFSGNPIGLLSDGLTVTTDNNLWFGNGRDLVGQALSREEAVLNAELLFLLDFGALSNALGGLRIALNRLNSGEGLGFEAAHLLDLQRVHLTLGDLYRTQGMAVHAARRYAAVLQLDPTTELAQTAQRHLAALAGL